MSTSSWLLGTAGVALWLVYDGLTGKAIAELAHARHRGEQRRTQPRADVVAAPARGNELVSDLDGDQRHSELPARCGVVDDRTSRAAEERLAER